ncbi:MAG: alpha/beta hydrolase [Pseudomonadota bacterium]
MVEAAGTAETFSAPDGTRLSARVAGPENAPPLVLVHGFSMSSLLFEKQLSGPLSARFRVIAPDLRGHGNSDPGSDLSALGRAETYAGDLKAAIASFARRDPIVAGWSFGGRVICAYLADGGAAAGAVFFASVTDDVLPDGSRPHGPAAAVIADMCGADDLAAAHATVRFVDGMFAAPPDPSVRDLILAIAASVPRNVRRNMRGLKSDNRALLQSLAVPVLAIHGEADAVIRSEAAAATADAAQHGSLMLMPGIGHAPFLEAQHVFDTALERFAEHCGL